MIGNLKKYQDNNGKFGFKDENNNVVIKAKFDEAYYFRKGIALVVIDGKFGVIDTNGEMIVECKHEAFKTIRDKIDVCEFFLTKPVSFWNEKVKNDRDSVLILKAMISYDFEIRKENYKGNIASGQQYFNEKIKKIDSLINA